MGVESAVQGVGLGRPVVGGRGGRVMCTVGGGVGAAVRHCGMEMDDPGSRRGWGNVVGGTEEEEG